MINININGELTGKQKTLLKIIESLSNAKGDINIEGDIDEEILNIIIVQLTLIDKLKELKPKDGKNGIDGISIKGEPGKDGEKGEPGKDGLSIKGESGKDGLNGKDGIDGVDGDSGEGLEFKWNGQSLGIRKIGDKKREYRDLQGSTGIGRQGTPGDIISDTTTITENTTLIPAYHKIIVDATDNDIIIQLPTAVGIRNKEYIITRLDNSINTVTILPKLTQTIYGSNSEYLKQYETLVFSSDNINFL